MCLVSILEQQDWIQVHLFKILFLRFSITSHFSLRIMIHSDRFKNIFKFFILCGWMFDLHACLCATCIPRAPEDRRSRWLCALVGVGIEPKCSLKIINALNCWGISPPLGAHIWTASAVERNVSKQGRLRWQSWDITPSPVWWEDLGSNLLKSLL